MIYIIYYLGYLGSSGSNNIPTERTPIFCTTTEEDAIYLIHHFFSEGCGFVIELQK